MNLTENRLQSFNATIARPLGVLRAVFVALIKMGVGFPVELANSRALVSATDNFAG